MEHKLRVKAEEVEHKLRVKAEEVEHKLRVKAEEVEHKFLKTVAGGNWAAQIRDSCYGQ